MVGTGSISFRRGRQRRRSDDEGHIHEFEARHRQD